ncbi:MAG: thiamine-phosphate kinase [Longimicrobiales bacterium]
MAILNIPLGHGAEFDLIRRFLQNPMPVGDMALGDSVRVGPGDDCAIVRGENIALSVDMAVEDVHFKRAWLQPEEIGYRSVAAALSDLAAVAATPIGVLVALAANADDADDVAASIMAGARTAAESVGATLLGGDITRSPGPLMIDCVVVGNAIRPVLRRGARPGDSIWVTGELGAAASAVAAWKAGREPEASARLAFALPMPRISESLWLSSHNVVNALIDISDGLAGDITHIAAASGVRIVLDMNAIPIHPVAHMGVDDHEAALRLALSGGEDYELCFAAPAGSVERLIEEFEKKFALKLTCVGTAHEGAGVSIRDFDGTARDLDVRGFNHFDGTPK